MTTSNEMKVAVVDHDPTEPAGMFGERLASRAVTAGTVRLDETNELPPWAGDTALVLAGGPMSVNDESEYPWLKEEKALIRDAVASRRPVLGICLGAQLIASALGARVDLSVRETGWKTLSGLPDNPLFPRTFPAFQFHGETFDLPEGANLLATSGAVLHQAFAYGSALGHQFHIEATSPMIAAWTADIRVPPRPNGILARLDASAKTCSITSSARRPSVRARTGRRSAARGARPSSSPPCEARGRRGA